MKNLSKTEIQFFITFLEIILINQQDSSCNDLILPITDNNLSFMKIFNQYVPEKEQLTILDNEIVGLDLSVTEYFINKLKEID